MQIHFLRNYLEHLEIDIAKEVSQIEERAVNGIYDSIGDIESAYDYPLFRIRFGTHSIYYEINSIVENQLHKKAEPIFGDFKKVGKWVNKKSVSELPMWAVIEALNSRYGKIEEKISDWEKYATLRKKVNSFKHSQGRRKAVDVEVNERGAFELTWESSIEEAQEYLRIIPRVIDEISCLKPI